LTIDDVNGIDESFAHFIAQLFVVLEGTVGEQIARHRVYLIFAEVKALKELGPKLFLGDFLRHVLNVLELHRRICLEYGLNVVV
jgi:hypothetical protein